MLVFRASHAQCRIVQPAAILARTAHHFPPISRSITVLPPRFRVQRAVTSGRRFNSTAPPSAPQLSRWRQFLQTLGRVTLVTLLSTGGLFYYISYKDRTPGPQEPFDPSKKTIVVLGSGWGATSLLKSLNNEDYNVVRILHPCLFTGYNYSQGCDKSEELFPFHPSTSISRNWDTRCTLYHPGYPTHYSAQGARCSCLRG